MLIISSDRDLRNWLEEAMGSDVTSTDVDAVWDEVRDMPHPPYGADWEVFLDGLPDSLRELLTNA